MSSEAESLSRQAYRRLENLIVTLKLKPGVPVTERQLIALAGPGRTPVREAIQKLEWQGLIRVRPRVGLQIAEIVPGDHQGIMQVRRQLEPLAAALVAEYANEEQRSALVDCAKAMSAASDTGDILGFLEADRRFDEIFEEACPNRFLVSALAPLQTHSRRLWFSKASAHRMDQSAARHIAVIRAIQARDINGARQAMETLLAYLDNS
ncbi:GntR family transcriptional regulator [Neorhizobium sp. Rsf11]|uniref:GntR family transcriptional regulator n=2 Tax=Neorhizobium TaxID=1525371 RepID=A0ABV0M3G6_9HYPH|nr:GntR family transcriptional regulator [Neorhizobium petrolearium]MCC2610103.1 GntR family transcriptional regulator [Neorhizobium petrolearium]WGI71144.1 GntR family transcriptional regulator [Neorhizobium petrolearium]